VEFIVKTVHIGSLNVCLFIFTPEVTAGAFDLSSTSSVLKKELLKIGKIQFAQYQLSDDVDNIVDLLIISETKLDESFNDNLFSVDGYKVQRRDRNQYGGGLLTFIRSGHL
jgi:hypothetical protein